MDCTQWCLCCVASFPFGAWVFSMAGSLMDTMVASASLRLFRLLRLVEPASIITAPIGIFLLFKLRKTSRVNRGCDCCCSCPFPAWSLLVQFLDIIGFIIVIVVAAPHDDEMDGD